MPGVPAIQLVLGLYSYKPTKKVLDEATALQTKSIEAQGAPGRQLLSDIDVYLGGHQPVVLAEQPDDAAVHAHRHLRAQRAQVAVPGPGRRRGGRQRLVPRRRALQARRHPRRRGLRGPARALRPRDGDHDDAQLPRPDQGQRGQAARHGAHRQRQLPLDARPSSRPRRARPRRGRPRSTIRYGPPQLASNILIASGKASQTGSPLFVGGPQIGYNYPGLTLEMDLHGPDIHVRGATSAPFPGYMLIGRGADYAWTLTSADGDIIDTYAETLCGGSKVRYLYKGKCRAMESVDAGTISKGGKSVHVTFRRTVHGPVVRLREGARHQQAGGAVDAALELRPRDGRPALLPADDLRPRALGQGLHPRRVQDAADLQLVLRERERVGVHHLRAAARCARRASTPTCRSTARASTSGRATCPTRRTRRSSTPRPATSSTGTTSRPRTSRPPTAAGTSSRCSVRSCSPTSSGASPSRRWPPSWPRPTRRRPRTCASSSCGRRSRRCSTAARRPTRAAKQLVAAAAGLARRRRQPARRRPRRQDRRPRRADPRRRVEGPHRRRRCATASAPRCASSSRAATRASTSRPAASTAAGTSTCGRTCARCSARRCAGAYHLRYCGDGSVKTCSTELWAALDAARKRLAAQQGADPTAWRAPEAKEQITFAPLPLITMQYTNKPTGIHQVMQFGP